MPFKTISAGIHQGANNFTGMQSGIFLTEQDAEERHHSAFETLFAQFERRVANYYELDFFGRQHGYHVEDLIVNKFEWF